MDAEGTAAKALVCETFWNDLFSFNAWNSVLAVTQQPRCIGYLKGYCYITTWKAIHASTSAGCNWCQFLARPKCTKGELEVWVEYDEASECMLMSTLPLYAHILSFSMIYNIRATFGSTIRLGQYCRMCSKPLAIYAMSFRPFLTISDDLQCFYGISDVCSLISDLSLHQWTIYAFPIL